jgi:transcriptional regulator of aromatic amino acid metabolism
MKLNKTAGFVRMQNITTTQNAFAFAVNANTNAVQCGINLVEIDFPPIADIIRACSEIFRSIDRDDEFQCDIARTVWMLKTTSTLTMLPFDDERLRLTALIESLGKSVDSVPEISGSVETLRNVVFKLISASTNPKRIHLLSVIENGDAEQERIAMGLYKK